MQDGPTYIVSDAHLGASTEDREASFRAFLHHAARDASTLVLNGDIFDFWYEYGSVVPRGHTRLLGTLAEIVDAGIPVHLLGGNHDWWFGSFFTDEIGVIVHQDPVVLELAGLRCLVAHGDGLGKGDLGYRMLRMMFRGRLTQWAFRWLHPDWGAAIARRVSLTETRQGAPSEEDIGRSRYLERWALATLGERPDLDLVTVGHTHVPAQARTEAGQWYFNTGDWIHFRSYLKLLPGADPLLMQWQDERPAIPLALPMPS
jgi:UDP-2,3-diacylglucosamine hydrolase